MFGNLFLKERYWIHFKKLCDEPFIILQEGEVLVFPCLYILYEDV